MPTPFSPDDLRFFDKNGYVVLRNAVPPENLQAVVDALFEFLGMHPNHPDDWYRPPLPPGGMIEMYQHQALWDNRQYPRLYEAFRQLFGTDALWVMFDRVNFKPPQRAEHPAYDHQGFLHWDADITRAAEMPLSVQGVLYLTETTEAMGGFQCAPGHHRVVKEWAKQVTPGAKERPDMTGVPVVPIPGAAGDLVIWNRLLYHGNGRNVSDKPRLAQYITMFPVPTDAAARERMRADRIRRWRERLPADWRGVPDDAPPSREQMQGATAALTPLGRKLLGQDRWEDEARGEAA